MFHRPTAPPTPYVLALDVGTSSARAALFDAAGQAIPGLAAQQTYAPQISTEGASTFDPAALVGTTATVIDAVLHAAGKRASEIRAVATDTFWHSLIALDAQDRPLTPIITWADTRPRQAARELRAQLDASVIHQRTGAPLHASYWPAKLRWLAQTQPEAIAQVAQFVSAGEYLHRQFLGRSVCSLCMASGTGLLATQARVWDADLVAFLGLRAEQLPPLGDLGDALTGLAPDYARRWPALAAVPWYPALGDGATANVGSDCTTPAHIALTVGTSSAMRAVAPLDDRALPNSLWRYLLDRNRMVLGGALSEGGNLLAWLARTCQIGDLAAAEVAAAQLPPAAQGLDVLPFIAGERSLGWHDDARMIISGITSETTPTDLVRAMLEALAYRLGALHAALARALPESAGAQMIGSGGTLLRSALLQGIVADVLGAPLALTSAGEASARGAALLALRALGALPADALPPTDIARTVASDPTHAAIYRRAAERQQALYDALLGAKGQ